MSLRDDMWLYGKLTGQDPNSISISCLGSYLDGYERGLESTKWIPVSEKLPEKNGRYLVTRELNAAGNTWNRVYIVNYSDLMGLKKEKVFWIGNVGKNDFEQLQDVTAWQPLPEPYKEN